MWFVIIASAAISDWDVTAHGARPSLESCQEIAESMYRTEAKEVRSGYDSLGTPIGQEARDAYFAREFYCATKPDDRSTWELQPRPEDAEFARVETAD